MTKIEAEQLLNDLIKAACKEGEEIEGVVIMFKIKSDERDHHVCFRSGVSSVEAVGYHHLQITEIDAEIQRNSLQVGLAEIMSELFDNNNNDDETELH